jgi:predicted amidohydrolase
MTSVVGDPAANLHSIDRLTRAAVARSAEIICFPELSVSGYNTAERTGEAANGGAIPDVDSVPGEATRALIESANRTGAWIVAGLLELDPSGIRYNTQVVVSPGGIEGKYRKTHVPTTEIGTWCQGDALPVFIHPKIRFGIEICYDSHFPEVSAALAGRGAELILMPHASGGDESGLEKRARWERYVPSRAYDNTVFVGICNQVGDNGSGHDFRGVTFACDPLGRIVASAETHDSEEILLVDLSASDLTDARRVPESFYRHFRRPRLYSEWAELSE